MPRKRKTRKFSIGDRVKIRSLSHTIKPVNYKVFGTIHGFDDYGCMVVDLDVPVVYDNGIETCMLTAIREMPDNMEHI